MTFGEAIEALKAGDSVSRDGWGGENYRELDIQGGLGPGVYFRVTYSRGFTCVWNPEFTDMLEKDWFVVVSTDAKDAAEALQVSYGMPIA